MSSPTDNNALFAPAINYWALMMRSFFPLIAAPQSLNEPILPWTFAGVVVNNENSGDPATEQAVVNSDSYGRQLGRISDALEVLISKLTEEEKKDKRISDFVDMKKKIDEIKDDRATVRFNKVVSDLDDLRNRNKETFDKRIDSINALAKK
ncbi:hypothetical protein [Paraburkholderia dinghuensis]|uniref:Uncharacterized protein n=1 Tax=Paraburkholderia dinghuensis TaxID=2305225 RepID=A0A3N6MW69_9BURK|nr:hypothetical protein [Paraburkholderia dinghuensis]RQH00612.1 hypothetical protein D1Y85_24825 [Paraburkholderia dinghuensis]